jgi:hypothetical protein
VGGGGRELSCLYDRYAYFEELCAQDKIYFVRHFAWLKYFTYRLLLALASSYKQHILLPAKFIKISYSLAELCVKSVYLNSFGWRGRNVHEAF